ncbi:unnamed protein product, partial [Pylaiella littoralis]
QAAVIRSRRPKGTASSDLLRTCLLLPLVLRAGGRLRRRHHCNRRRVSPGGATFVCSSTVLPRGGNQQLGEVIVCDRCHHHVRGESLAAMDMC